MSNHSSVCVCVCVCVQVKCEQYWSEDIGSVFETENKTMSVTTLSVTPFADFVIRQFTVKNVSVSSQRLIVCGQGCGAGPPPVHC